MMTDNQKHSLYQTKTVRDPLIKSILNNVFEKRKNANIIVTGSAGSGKSTIGENIMYKTDHRFANSDPKVIVPARIVSRPIDFLKAINEKFFYGTAIMFDEAGAGISHREWWDFLNRKIGEVMEIFRYKRIIAIFTAITINYVDKDVRKLMDFQLTAKEIDFRNKVNYFSASKVILEAKTDDIILLPFRVRTDEGLKIVDPFMWKAPPDPFLKAYDVYADGFKTARIQEITDEIIARKKLEESKVKITEMTDEMIMQKIKDNLKRYLSINPYRGKHTVKWQPIKSDFGISKNRAESIKHDMETDENVAKLLVEAVE